MSRERELGKKREEAGASLPGEGDIPGCWSDLGRAEPPGPVEAAIAGRCARAVQPTEEQETGQTGRRGAAVSSTPCSHPASLQPARSEPRGMMPVPAG